MNNIEDITNIQKSYENHKMMFKNTSNKIETKVHISERIIKNQPVPIIYLNDFSLVKYTNAKCSICNKRSDYMLSDKYFCDKHIHKELVVINVINKS